MLVVTALLFLVIRFAGRFVGEPQGTAPVLPGRGGPADADVVLVHILLALIVVIASARILGSLIRRMNQPAVIGEMIAGIILGPSLLGRVAPALFGQLFPASIWTVLSVLAQVGVILFMFLVGVDLDPKLLRGRAESSVAISHASIVAPFLLGAALALWLYPTYSLGGVSFTVFALFMGAAMSVTAFPVLARILTDRGMHKTHLGTIALSCAAVDDVTAWCLLAFVVSVARARPEHVLLTVVWTAGFIIAVFMLAKPAADRLARRQQAQGQSSQGAIAVVFVAILLSALATQRIGIHSLFGAFLIGVVIPHDSVLASDLRAKLEDVTTVLLLPVFFAFTGLRTQIGLLHHPLMWATCGAIVLVASLGKFGGSYIAGRVTGLDRWEAASLGILMNTRGLMELIALNIGLDLGVLSPALFAMLVIMAVVTTLATTPILQAVSFSRGSSLSAVESTPQFSSAVTRKL